MEDVRLFDLVFVVGLYSWLWDRPRPLELALMILIYPCEYRGSRVLGVSPALIHTVIETSLVPSRRHMSVLAKCRVHLTFRNVNGWGNTSSENNNVCRF